MQIKTKTRSDYRKLATNLTAKTRSLPFWFYVNKHVLVFQINFVGIKNKEKE